MSLSFQTFQHLQSMPSISQGSVQAALSRLYLKKIQNFLHTDRNMHTCRSTSFSYYFFYHICIFFRLMLFIFFTEPLRVGSGISHAAFMWFFLIFHYLFSCLFLLFFIKSFLVTNLQLLRAQAFYNERFYLFLHSDKIWLYSTYLPADIKAVLKTFFYQKNLLLY